MAMFIRFVTKEIDDTSHVRQGIFQKASDLSKGGEIFGHQREGLQKILDWFDKSLKKPTSLSRSKKPRAEEKAISWYRDSAHKHIAKMQEMVEILRDVGVPVEMIKTSNPGFIVYEDEFQVVAEHFQDTGA